MSSEIDLTPFSGQKFYCCYAEHFNLENGNKFTDTSNHEREKSVYKRSVEFLRSQENGIYYSKGSAGGSLEGKTNTEGDTSIQGEIHIISKSDDNKSSVEISAEGSIKNDRDGHLSGETVVKVSYDFEF